MAEPLLPSRYEAVAAPGWAGTASPERAGILPAAHDDDRSGREPTIVAVGTKPLATPDERAPKAPATRKPAVPIDVAPLASSSLAAPQEVPLPAAPAPPTRQHRHAVATSPNPDPEREGGGRREREPSIQPIGIRPLTPPPDPSRAWHHAARPPGPASGPATHPALPEDPVQPVAPEVRISIGVVEVHALPSRALPVRQSPAPRPGLSLSDYLAQRRGKVS